MLVIQRPADLPKAGRGVVGFVPTMGALHEGHAELIRTARKECDQVVVSIFVNPTQFGPHEDFAKYPRTLGRDASICLENGVDVLFTPGVEDMYQDDDVRVTVGRLSTIWEGAARPGHFDGVATVVAKLFNMVQPTHAYFGQKDLQQCQVIRHLVRDLHMPVQLRIVPTVREEDGLAMSSRNRYLTVAERGLAAELHRSLQAVADSRQDISQLHTTEAQESSRLQSFGFAVDYLRAVSLPSMQLAETTEGVHAIIVAAKLGSTRLIDNLVIEP